MPIVIMAIGLIFLAADVPLGDDYDAILAYLNHPWPERLWHLADFHNEHRIIPTRIVAEIVYRVLGHIDFRAVMWIGNLGWWLFAAVFARLFLVRGGIVRGGAIFAMWMLIGFNDKENVFWAMASVQNHWVVVFAFAACLAFVRRADVRWFAIALAFAVAATFTSGGGLLIFPALALMAICDYVFGRERTMNRRRIFRIIVFLVVAVTASAFMLHGLPHNDDPMLVMPTDPVQRAKAAIGFCCCFFGNSIPLETPAMIIGVIVILWGFLICGFAPRYRRDSLAVFAFTAYLAATILAASVFRGNAAAYALAGRYHLLSAAVIVSLAYLTLVEVPISELKKKRLLGLLIAGGFALSTIYLVRGVPYQYQQRIVLENGISEWPTSDNGLAYPTTESGLDHASAILRQSVQRSVYAP